jgi:CDP-diglyceride synthetase
VLAKKLGYNAQGVLWLIGANALITFVVPGISWQGHLGGLIAGTLVAAIFAFAPARNRSAIQWGGCAAVLIILVGLVLGLPPFAVQAELGIFG